MREFSAPETYPVPETGSLTDDIVANALHKAQTVTFSRRDDGEWHDVTAAQFHREVVAVAKGLVAAGVQPADRVALISKTRYECTLLDYAIWFAGATTVPIYETSSAEQIRWILSDSAAVLVVAESLEHVDRVERASSELPALARVVCLDKGELAALVDSGVGISDDEIEKRRSSLTPDSLATLIYTSGTTGRPKGCCLTHGNFMFELGVAVDELGRLFDTEGASTLLFLPLAHIFARIIQVGAIKAGIRLGHSADIKNLVDDLKDFQPTFILAVPRVFEKVFNTASQRATSDGRGKIFNVAVGVAVAYSQAMDRNGPGLVLRARHAVFDRLVYRKLRDALGGKTEYAVSGGAPLGERLAHFFRGVGLEVLEGYGLTETTAAVTVNLPGTNHIGTVGRPIPGTSVRVADDGELLFRGGQIFSGYWHNDAATAESIGADCWFRTGDIGEVDDEGFVRITGRKKEILVTAGGKNVAPAVLEDRLRAHYLVSQCMVVGDGKPFVAALVTIDPDALPYWAESRGKAGKLGDLVDDPDLVAEVQAAVDEANSAVSRAEAIRKFTILADDWTEESGELTPTLKLRRSLVLRTYHDTVEALYI
ncbi:MAG: AMP-dependent synthetase/ligase [Nocardioidaceae bacterium]